jgi:branched-chain amino acid transport system permease protein
VVALVLAVWTFNASGYQITVLGGAMAFAIAGTGVGLQLKTLRLLSLAQGSMMALGAYTQLVLVGRDHWSFLPALVVSLLLAAGVGVVLGCASARVRTHYYILLTAAVEAIVAAFISGLPSLTGGAQGAATPAALNLLGAQISTPKDFAELATVVAVVVAALADLCYRSALGRRLIAAGASPALARGSGISLTGANVAGNVLLAVFGALAGALYAPLIGYLGPDEFALSVSITCVLVGVIATQWSFSMAILAAVALQELTQQLSSVGSVSGVIYGAIIMVVGVVLAAGDRGLIRRLRSGRRSAPSAGRAGEEMAVES